MAEVHEERHVEEAEGVVVVVVLVEDQVEVEDRVTTVVNLDICRGIVPRSVQLVHLARAAVVVEAEAHVTSVARKDISPGTVQRGGMVVVHLAVLMIASVTTAERADIYHETVLMLVAGELEVEAAAEEMNVLRVEEPITSRETVPRRQQVEEVQMEHRTCAVTTAMRWDTCLVTVQLRGKQPAS